MALDSPEGFSTGRPTVIRLPPTLREGVPLAVQVNTCLQRRQRLHRQRACTLRVGGHAIHHAVISSLIAQHQLPKKP